MDDVKKTVKLTIDGVNVTVPEGTNLIEAARQVGIEIPYYCYHPHLSVSGNCRMCQVEVEGMPRLTIGCNTAVKEAMVVKTQRTSDTVAEAQRATLEFILANHPLDCTVCDQAGHCKLQDYYYEYSREPSRHQVEKKHKVKALPLGPDVIFDGERCILCTRCVRFCDEVTKTSELGIFNRGDSSLVGTYPGVELDNALSGSVVDLCPVGALTHRQWRFNTRVWFSKWVNTICTGCSTGCNAKVAVRDGRVVCVKARPNEDVNLEWMCNEGRYGFERFQPAKRLLSPMLKGKENCVGFRELVWSQANALASRLASGDGQDASRSAVFLSPFLTLEEVCIALEFAKVVMGVSPKGPNIAMQLRQRDLTEEEKILISPDRAPNASSALLFGIGGLSSKVNWRDALEKSYQNLLNSVRTGQISKVLLVGDAAISDQDVDNSLTSAMCRAAVSVAITSRGIEDSEGAHFYCDLVLPTRTVNEKSGVMLNKDLRFQRLNSLLLAPATTKPEWQILGEIAAAAGRIILPDEVVDDRLLFRFIISEIDALSALSLSRIGESGLSLESLRTNRCSSSNESLASDR